MSSRNLWNRQLELQVRVASQISLRYLRSLSAFKNARSVLEIGSGNGAFLTDLARHFRTKTFHGIDLSRELTRFARRRAAGLKNLSFEVTNLYDLPMDGTKFEFVVARLITQHLPDISSFMKVASSLLTRGGHLLIIEAHDESIQLVPEVPTVKKLLSRIRRTQPLGGPNIALRAVKRNAGRAGLVSAKEEIVLQIVVGARKATVSHLWENVAQLFLKTHSIPVDSRLSLQLAAWQSTSGSRAQFGYHHLLFERRPPWFSPSRLLSAHLHEFFGKIRNQIPSPRLMPPRP